jgi:hypothetical protein
MKTDDELKKLQDAAESLLDAANSLHDATWKETIDRHRTWDLLFELDDKRKVLHDVLVHSFPALDEPSTGVVVVEYYVQYQYPELRAWINTESYGSRERAIEVAQKFRHDDMEGTNWRAIEVTKASNSTYRVIG